MKKAKRKVGSVHFSERVKVAAFNKEEACGDLEAEDSESIKGSIVDD